MGIVVANAPESTVVSAAEHAIGMLLALSRNIPQAHAALKQGRWERGPGAGQELADKTLGVLGFGRIGQQVARRAVGLEMHVLVHDPYVGRAFPRARRHARRKAWSRCSPTPTSSRSTSRSPARPPAFSTGLAFARMKEGVGPAREHRARRAGGRERTPLEALRSGKVGAALDIGFSRRALLGFPLLDLDQVVVTPHLAASTAEAQTGPA